MEVMMQIETHHLSLLREEFLRKPDGLTLQEFVVVMLRYLPEETVAADPVGEVRDLCELFAQVDVNGDGTMEWDEFSAFCIEAGMAANLFKARKELRYVEHVGFTKHTQHGLHISRLRFFPRLGRLLVAESGTKSWKAYFPVADYNRGAMFQTEVVTHSKHSDGGDVLDFAYIASLKLICCSLSDMTMLFYDSSTIEQEDNVYNAHAPPPRVVKKIHTPRPQRTIVYSQKHGTIYSAGADATVMAWLVVNEPAVGLEVLEAARMTAHSGMITDLTLAVHSDLLVSSSMDHSLNVWDAGTYAHVAKRLAHSKGVRSLCYVKEADIVVSAGFDLDMHAWDMASMGERPLFHLIGHKYSLVSVVQVPGRQQAVSVDSEGMFKWWDCRRSSSVMDMERCLQTWTTAAAQVSLKPFSPRTMCTVGPGDGLVCAGGRMHLFEALRLKALSAPPVIALFNPTENTIFTAADRDVKVWDAVNGDLLREFPEVVSAEVTSMCFDDRARKFLLTTQDGRVAVFNCLNGALMKEFTAHTSEVSTVAFCEEDKCCISVSWDRTIMIHDEETADGELLRCVTNAHDADITSLAFSYDLSLFATGSANGRVKVWDFQYGSLDGNCIGHTCEVAAVAFMDPYPILVTTDLSGMVAVWFVRPHIPRYTMLASWFNVVRPDDLPVDAPMKDPEAVTSLCVVYEPEGGEEIVPGVRRGRHLVVCGNDMGEIGVWDVTHALQEAGVTAVKEVDMPKNKGSYNARRRINRDDKFAGVSDSDSDPEPSRRLLSAPSSAGSDGCRSDASERSLADRRASISRRSSVDGGRRPSAHRRGSVGREVGDRAAAEMDEHQLAAAAATASYDHEKAVDGAGSDGNSDGGDSFMAHAVGHPPPASRRKTSQYTTDGDDDGAAMSPNTAPVATLFQGASSKPTPGPRPRRAGSRSVRARGRRGKRHAARRRSKRHDDDGATSPSSAAPGTATSGGSGARRKDQQPSTGRLSHSSAMSIAKARVLGSEAVLNVNWFRCHNGAVRSLQWMEDASCLLTSSVDGHIAMVTLSGELQALMNTSSQDKLKWRAVVDADQRERQLRTAANTVYKSVEPALLSSTPLETADMSLDYDAKQALLIEKRQRAVNLAASVAHLLAKGGREGHDQRKAARERSRLFGQLFGEVTWLRTVAEQAQAEAKAAAEAERQMAEAAAARKRARREKKRKKRRDSTEVTLNELRDMDNEDSGEEEAKAAPAAPAADNMPDDPNDWGPGSQNQARKLYPSLHDELHRIDVKRERRLAAMSGSASTGDAFAPSEFLVKKLGLPPPTAPRVVESANTFQTSPLVSRAGDGAGLMALGQPPQSAPMQLEGGVLVDASTERGPQDLRTREGARSMVENLEEIEAGPSGAFPADRPASSHDKLRGGAEDESSKEAFEATDAEVRAATGLPTVPIEPAPPKEVMLPALGRGSGPSSPALSQRTPASGGSPPTSPPRGRSQGRPAIPRTLSSKRMSRNRLLKGRSVPALSPLRSEGPEPSQQLKGRVAAISALIGDAKRLERFGRRRNRTAKKRIRERRKQNSAAYRDRVKLTGSRLLGTSYRASAPSLLTGVGDNTSLPAVAESGSAAPAGDVPTDLARRFLDSASTGKSYVDMVGDSPPDSPSRLDAMPPAARLDFLAQRYADAVAPDEETIAGVTRQVRLRARRVVSPGGRAKAGRNRDSRAVDALLAESGKRAQELIDQRTPLSSKAQRVASRKSLYQPDSAMLDTSPRGSPKTRRGVDGFGGPAPPDGDDDGGKAKDAEAHHKAAADGHAEEARLAELRRRKRFGAYTRKDVMQIKRLFAKLDRDGDGTIDLREFTQDPEVGANPHLADHIESMFASIDKDHSGSISADELVPIIFPRANAQEVRDICTFISDNVEVGPGGEAAAPERALSTAALAELKDLFELYDTDNSGAISLEEFEAAFGATDALYGKKAASRMAGRVQRDELRDIMDGVDADGNKELDFEEFCKLMASAGWGM